MLDHAAPSVIAPLGADLRVVARVRLVTPNRRVAKLRVAMRVQVTEQDEDERSLVRAIKHAVRTLAVAAVLVAALAVGAERAHSVVGGHADGENPAVASAPAGDRVGLRSPPPARHARGHTALPPAGDEAPDAPLISVTSTAHAVAPTPALAPVDLTAATWWFVVESQRTPRPALATTVVPSPD